MTLDSRRGMGLVLVAAMLWGSTGTAQSFAPVGLSSAWVGALRLLVAGGFFVAWLACTQPQALSRAALARLPWRDVAGAAACMGLYNLCFFAGVREAGVALGTALAIGSAPVWAGLMQWGLMGRRPPARWWLGAMIAVVGVGLMGDIEPASAEPPFLEGWRLAFGGALLCLLAGASYAAYALIAKRMTARAAPAPVTTAVFVGAALVALPAAGLLDGLPSLAHAAASGGHGSALGVAGLVLAWLGVVSTGLAYLLFNHGLRAVSGASAVALALAEPVTAVMLAVTLVGETLSSTAWVGLVMVLAGLMMVIRAESRGLPAA